MKLTLTFSILVNILQTGMILRLASKLFAAEDEMIRMVRSDAPDYRERYAAGVTPISSRRPKATYIMFLALLLWPAAAWAQSASLSDGGGSALVTGGDRDGWATHIVFDFADGVNQVEVAHFTAWVDARQSVPLSVGFQRDPCKTYQVDTFWGLAPAARYTMSDLGNVRLLASKMLPATSPCRNPPDAPPPPPSCPTYTYTFGGSPAIARFPPGFVNPWLPLWRGPFYLFVPAGRYLLTVVTGDQHVGPDGKYDGPQDERGNLWLDNGQIIGPTKLIPEFENSVTSIFRVNLLMDTKLFYFVHAATSPVTVPTDSFYIERLTFRCVP